VNLIWREERIEEPEIGDYQTGRALSRTTESMVNCLRDEFGASKSVGEEQNSRVDNRSEFATIWKTEYPGQLLPNMGLVRVKIGVNTAGSE